MGAATATCTGDADTTTGGPGVAATTSIAITDKHSLDSLIVIPLPGRYANYSDANGSRPRGAAGSASRIPIGANTDGGQPSPISTAIRIRSE